MKSTLILLLIAITFSVAGQNSYIPSERTFTTKDGLSSDKVHALHKDSQGFIWIGTENGLDRFDGQNFIHFNKSTHPKMTLDRVQLIAEDDEGYLWLVEKNKPFAHYFVRPTINFYNIHTGKFTTLEERFGDEIKFDKDQISFIKQLEDGSIFLFINQVGKSYCYQKGKFEEYKLPKDLIRVSDIRINKNGGLTLEAVQGMNNFERQIFKINKTGQINHQVHPDAAWSIQSNNKQYDLKLTTKNYLIGAKNLDAYELIAPDLAFSSTSNGLFIDHAEWNKKQELLWLKGETNLFVTKRNGDIVYQKEMQQDYFEMPILFDGHTTWYSDKQHGLIALTLSPNYFQAYQSFKDGFSNSARGIHADPKGNIWISTISGTLHKPYDATEFQYKFTNFFTSFFKDKDNHLWSFGENALFDYDLTTGKNKAVTHNLLNTFNYWSMYQAANNKIWLFGNFGHFQTFDPLTETFKKGTQLPVEGDAFYVYNIQKNDAQSVWLCTSQGLYLVDNHGKFIALYNNKQEDEFYLPTFDVHHLYIDKKGTIWLATGDAGLLEYRISNDEYRMTKLNHYTTKDGLSCDILHAVYEDDYEYLWLSSNEGLMQFDKRTAKVITYTTENGLLHNEFNRISHFQAENGKLYFGGLTGVISFHPQHFSEVRNEGHEASLVVTDFQQFSAKKEHFENLTQELSQTQTIRLKPNDRFFKLNVALLDFKGKATYQYRIRDLYDWQTTQDSDLNISGLPYGKYTLEIKAFNASQNEAANTLIFPIHVLRPFYLQWWFLILVLGSLGSAVFYFFKWRTQQLLVLQETEQLRQLDSMKSQFFANISHELRTPITLILAPLTEYIKNNSLSEKQHHQLTKIQSNGKNLLNLVNEVLDLSKLEANKLELHLSPTKIPQFIERVVMNFESAAKVKGINYEFLSFLQKGVVAQFDQAKLEKILNNLLSNALKFTSNEGIIQIMTTQIENDLVIKVKDSGKGIAAEDLPQVFDRYFQSNNKSIEGGTGIGLALTKELVELMNGEILVQSEIGEGTEFEIRLPIELVENEALEVIIKEEDENLRLLNFQSLVNVQETKKSKNNPDSNRDTILLVEDNPSLQQFIQSVLAPYYNVLTANNGLEALEILNSKFLIPNLILSDVMMPEMDGFTLLEKVKADDRFCSIPFILLTARADIKDKLRGLRIGVDDYMTKPFEVEELLLRIKNLIGNAKSRQWTESNEEEVKESLEVTPKQLYNKQTSVLEEPSTINSEPSTIDLNWLEEVELLVKKELKNSQLSVDFLASELYISKRQLYRKIKKTTGMTPHQYIKSFRLQIAKRILETEDVYTLTEVCNAVGLENTTHFAKAYEKEFGKRPHSLLKKY